MEYFEGFLSTINENLKKWNPLGVLLQQGEGVTTRSKDKVPPPQTSARPTKRTATPDYVDDGAIPSTSKQYHPPKTKKAKTFNTELPSETVSPSASVILDVDLGEENENDLFSEETKIFENKSLKVYVVKEDHKRQKIFRIEDHLYVVRIKVLEGKAPLLKDIEEILKKAFQFMLKNLKTYYKPEDTNLIYLTIYQVSSLKLQINPLFFDK
jgi:hypothetical protein